MPISSYDRRQAARAALKQYKGYAKQAEKGGIEVEEVIEQAEANAPNEIIPGKPPGKWKKSPTKGWIREASEGGNTIYQPWVGVEGSSPSNPHLPSGTMPTKLTGREGR